MNRYFCRSTLSVAMFLLWTSVSAVVISPPAIADTITLNSGSYLTEVAPSSGADDTHYPTSLPYAATGSSVSLFETAIGAYALSQNDFNISFTDARSGGALDYAMSYGFLAFHTDSDTPYVLTGSYATAGGSDSAFNRLLVSLDDATTGFTQFYSFQQSNGSFVVGTPGTYSGSPTGTLFAGHDYGLLYQAFVSAYVDGDNGATATGFVNLAIGVPEPSSFVMLALGGLALVARWPRRAKKARQR